MYFELDDIKRRHSPYWDTYNSKKMRILA